jgi:hypothetical protein
VGTVPELPHPDAARFARHGLGLLLPIPLALALGIGMVARALRR